MEKSVLGILGHRYAVFGAFNVVVVDSRSQEEELS
jgi:hypothetical protein